MVTLYPRNLRCQGRAKSAANPLLDTLHAWLLIGQRQLLAKADATARAFAYTLGRWRALCMFASDGRVPTDNNAAENAIRPLALGGKNWLFVGSPQASSRAAVLMTLIESAKLCELDPRAYLKDVLTKLHTWPNSRLGELLLHIWAKTNTSAVSI
jgi:hypothetical protein